MKSPSSLGRRDVGRAGPRQPCTCCAEGRLPSIGSAPATPRLPATPAPIAGPWGLLQDNVKELRKLQSKLASKDEELDSLRAQLTSALAKAGVRVCGGGVFGERGGGGITAAAFR